MKADYKQNNSLFINGFHSGYWLWCQTWWYQSFLSLFIGFSYKNNLNDEEYGNEDKQAAGDHEDQMMKTVYMRSIWSHISLI